MGMNENKVVTNAWQLQSSRNFNIPFNYAWDEANSYWRPMGLGDGGSYSDRITASAKNHIHKFGSNPNVPSSVSTTSPEVIWDGSTNYVFPPDTGTGIQLKSSDAGDSQQIIIQGLDENFNSQSWTGDLNGQSEVNVDGTWSRVFRAFNNDNTDLDGDVNIHASGDDSTSYAKILEGNNQTLMAIYTVPADCTGYLTQYSATAHHNSIFDLSYTLQLRTRLYGKVFRVQEITSCTNHQGVSQELSFPINLPPKTDVVFVATDATSNDGTVHADFDIALHC